MRAIVALVLAAAGLAGCAAPEEATPCPEVAYVTLRYDERLDVEALKAQVQAIGWAWAQVGEDTYVVRPPFRNLTATVELDANATEITLTDPDPERVIALETHAETLALYLEREFGVVPAETESGVREEC